MRLRDNSTGDEYELAACPGEGASPCPHGYPLFLAVDDEGELIRFHLLPVLPDAVSAQAIAH